MNKYCLKCDKNVKIVKRKDLESVDMKGIIVEYKAKNAYCKICNEPIWVDKYMDYNIKSAHKSYKKMR